MQASILCPFVLWRSRRSYPKMSHHRFLRAAGTPEIDANIRNPRIYCVNSYFLMFSGFQVQTSYLASKNDVLTLKLLASF